MLGASARSGQVIRLSALREGPNMQDKRRERRHLEAGMPAL